MGRARDRAERRPAQQGEDPEEEERGPSSAQHREDAAGLSKGAVHYHFESKDELYERVLERCVALGEARILAVFAQPGRPLERVQRALLEMWAVRRDGVREIRVLMELHVLARQNRRIRKAYGEAIQRTRRQIVEVGLQELIAAGIKPKVPIEMIPRLLLATLDGLALHDEMDPLSAEEEAQIPRALEATAMGLFEL